MFLESHDNHVSTLNILLACVQNLCWRSKYLKQVLKCQLSPVFLNIPPWPDRRVRFMACPTVPTRDTISAEMHLQVHPHPYLTHTKKLLTWKPPTQWQVWHAKCPYAHAAMRKAAMRFPSQALHLGLWLGQSCLFLSCYTWFLISATPSCRTYGL